VFGEVEFLIQNDLDTLCLVLLEGWLFPALLLAIFLMFFQKKKNGFASLHCFVAFLGHELRARSARYAQATRRIESEGIFANWMLRRPRMRD
jgi:hypothetical protein